MISLEYRWDKSGILGPAHFTRLPLGRREAIRRAVSKETLIVAAKQVNCGMTIFILTSLQRGVSGLS